VAGTWWRGPGSVAKDESELAIRVRHLYLVFRTCDLKHPWLEQNWHQSGHRSSLISLHLLHPSRIITPLGIWLLLIFAQLNSRWPPWNVGSWSMHITLGTFARHFSIPLATPVLYGASLFERVTHMGTRHQELAHSWATE
jgi:formate-dependent nitrite reductase membrane component NrfD